MLVLAVVVKLNRPSYLWADCVSPSFALLRPYANFGTLILLQLPYLAEQNSKLSQSNLPSELEIQLGAMIKPGQRFHLAFQWKRSGGHVVTIEKGADGKLFLYDPQTGLHGSVSAYFSPKRNPQARKR